MYQPGNHPPPTRPQPVYQPGPSLTPSQPASPFTPSPAFPPAQPAHQAPRQNWFFRYRVLACLVGLSVIIGGIAGFVTAGSSGTGKPDPKTIGYSGSNAAEFAEAAGITDYEGLGQVPGEPAAFGELDGGMWSSPGNVAGSAACWLTHAGLLNWEKVHGTALNVQTVDLSEYCAAWLVTS